MKGGPMADSVLFIAIIAAIALLGVIGVVVFLLLVLTRRSRERLPPEDPPTDHDPYE
jgi:hypothetical protein